MRTYPSTKELVECLGVSPTKARETLKILMDHEQPAQALQVLGWACTALVAGEHVLLFAVCDWADLQATTLCFDAYSDTWYVGSPLEWC